MEPGESRDSREAHAAAKPSTSNIRTNALRPLKNHASLGFVKEKEREGGNPLDASSTHNAGTTASGLTVRPTMQVVAGCLPIPGRSVFPSIESALRMVRTESALGVAAMAILPAQEAERSLHTLMVAWKDFLDLRSKPSIGKPWYADCGSS